MIQNWVYGAKAPTDNNSADNIIAQMELSVQYHNALVGVEKYERRCWLDIRLKRATVEEKELAKEERELSSQIDALYEAVRNRRIEQRCRCNMTEEETKACDDLKKKRKEVWKKQREKRKVHNNNAEVIEESAILKEQVAEDKKKLYDLYRDRGLYWGNANYVAENLGSNLKRVEYDGSGCCRLQVITKAGEKKLSVQDTIDGKDDRIRLKEILQSDNRSGKLWELRWQLGLKPGHTKRSDMRYGIILFRLHRPLPNDAEILYLTVFRYWRGGTPQWRVMLCLRWETY